jgi:hypothetical protein
MKFTELQIWVMGSLNLLNISYTVSNKGTQITFQSKLLSGDIKLYPTTATYIFTNLSGKHNTFKIDVHESLENQKEHIRKMLQMHFNRNF